MSVEIKEFNKDLKQRFNVEVERLRGVLGPDVTIEHVGSSAVGIGGKNIVDILVGVSTAEDMALVRDLLASVGYREGHDTRPERIFMAFRADDDGTDRETGEGDLHVHIVVKGSEECERMIRLRDYLRSHPEKAQEYFEMKKIFAREAGYDRKKYKALKSEYVSELIREMKKENNTKAEG